MQHRIDDDQTSDDAARTAHTVARNVEDKFQALKDDVDLLKAEIRSTLVDLRESMTRDHTTINPQPQITAQEIGAKNGPSSNGPSNSRSQTVPGAVPKPSSGPASNQRHGLGEAASESGKPGSSAGPQGKESMDTVKMGNIIWWLGMVKGRGLTEEQIRPFLEAYEESGHLKPAMAKLTYRSLMHLEGVEEATPQQTFTAEQYSDCLLQLHNIICTPGYTLARSIDGPAGKTKNRLELPVAPKPKPKKAGRSRQTTQQNPDRSTSMEGIPGLDYPQ